MEFFLTFRHFVKNQYFQKRLRTSLDISIMKIKKFVFLFQIKNKSTYTASRAPPCRFLSFVGVVLDPPF